MATIVQTQGVLTATAAVNVTHTTMTASDTLTYVPGGAQVLFLYNTTASAVTINLAGTAPLASINVPGYGGSVSATGGKSVTVPASGSTSLQLDDISAFLLGTGTVTVTGGTGLTAHLFI